MLEKRERISGDTASSGTMLRNSSFGPMLEATALARISSPDVSLIPAALPSLTSKRSTGALVLISTPRLRATASIAALIAPMPPIAWPHTPLFPFTSPKQ